MRYPVEGYLLLVVAVLLIDGCLYILRDRFRDTWRFSLHKLVAFFWYFVSPVVFLIAFTALFVAMPHNKMPQLYTWFGYVIVSFLMVYTLKFIWLIWSSVWYLADKRVEHKRQAVNQPLASDKVPYPKLSRRKFLSQIGIVIATAPMASMLFGAFKGRYDFYTRYRKLSFPNLPASFEGFRIVQISDVHLGSFQGNFDALREVVKIINGHHPDLIVFTGDLVNNFHQETIGWEKVFGELRAPMGCYAILGNHDYGYYSRWDSDKERNDNFNKIVAANKRLGFSLLRNENVLLHRKGETIALAGVEYWGTSGHFPNTGDLQKASNGIHDQSFKILLSHDPDHWGAEVVGKTDYDLMLAGHTHGMQLGVDFKGFTWSPAKYKFKHWDGLYRQGSQFLFVNRGLGTLSMPLRVGMSPEITLIELSRGPVSTEPM